MEIKIKFSAEEASGFKNFMDAVKPPELPEEAFMKQVFFYGCNAINLEMRNMMEAKQAELQAQKAAATESAEQPETPEEGVDSGEE